MADITKNNSQISEVSLGDTINDWRTLTNDQIIAKLNLLNVYGIKAGIGLDVTEGYLGGGSGGTYDMATTAPFLLNLGGSWFTNQNLKLIGGGVSADSSIQKIFLGEANGKTLSFSQTATDLVIGNGHTYDTVPVGTTLAGQIAR